MRVVTGWQNAHKTMNWQWNNMLPKHHLLLLFIQAGLLLYYKVNLLVIMCMPSIKRLAQIFKTT